MKDYGNICTWVEFHFCSLLAMDLEEFNLFDLQLPSNLGAMSCVLQKAAG